MELLTKEVLYVVGGIVGALIAFLIVRYVIPWLKVKLGDQKLSYILDYVTQFMSAIEENGIGLTGEEKAEWVIDRIIEIFPNLKREYVKALIDGSMRALTQAGIINYHKETLGL